MPAFRKCGRVWSRYPDKMAFRRWWTPYGIVTDPFLRPGPAGYLSCPFRPHPTVLRIPRMLQRLLFASFILVAPLSLTAQDPAKPKPEAEKKGMMGDHMMGPWKEMNAFHRVMGATWHPASQKGDLAPLKAKANELLSAADAWAASRPPAMPASCGDSTVITAVKKVATEAKALLGMVESNADDDKLKSALKHVHDTFEVAEKGCAGHGQHGGAA